MSDRSKTAQFEFALHQRVRHTESGLTGTVIGRSDSAVGENLIRLRYVDAQGNPRDEWFYEPDLSETAT